MCRISRIRVWIRKWNTMGTRITQFYISTRNDYIL